MLIIVNIASVCLYKSLFGYSLKIGADTVNIRRTLL